MDDGWESKVSPKGVTVLTAILSPRPHRRVMGIQLPRGEVKMCVKAMTP